MEAQQSERASYWYGHLDRAAASGLSLRAYTEQAGVKRHRLYFWNSRRQAVAQARGNGGLFARVEVAEAKRHRPLGAQRLHCKRTVRTVFRWAKRAKRIAA